MAENEWSSTSETKQGAIRSSCYPWPRAWTDTSTLHTHLSPSRPRRWAVVHMVMNSEVLCKAANVLTG